MLIEGFEFHILSNIWFFIFSWRPDDVLLLHISSAVDGKALLLVFQRLAVHQNYQLKSSSFTSRIKGDEYWSAKEDLFIFMLYPKINCYQLSGDLRGSCAVKLLHTWLWTWHLGAGRKPNSKFTAIIPDKWTDHCRSLDS